MSGGRDDEDINLWMARRRREVANRGREAEAAAHETYGKAIRAGVDLRLPRSSDVQVYGARLIAQRAKAQPMAVASKPVSAAPRDEMTELRRRQAEFKKVVHDLDRENRFLAAPALAPVAVPFLASAPFVAGTVRAFAPGFLKAGAKAAIVSGGVGAGAEAGTQLYSRRRITDPTSVLTEGAKSAFSGATSAFTKRGFGIGGAAGGTFAANKLTGSSNLEAGAAAAGSALGHVLFPGTDADGMMASLAKQVVRSGLGKTVTKAGSAVEDRWNGWRRGHGGHR